MSQNSVEQFLGRLLTDDDFRELAGHSFTKAVMENGFKFSHEEITIIREMAFENLAIPAKHIDKRIKRSGIGVKGEAAC